MVPWKTIIVAVCIAVCVISIIVVFATHDKFGEYNTRIDAIKNKSKDSPKTT